MIDRETIETIFASRPPYKDDDEERTCRTMAESLSDQDREDAARSSYAYLMASVMSSSSSSSTGGTIHPRPTPDDRLRFAMRTARRHLVAESGDMDKALDKMRDTIQFRRDEHLDVLRRCFDDDMSIDRCEDPEDCKRAERFRELIRKEMDLQPMFLHGYDMKGNAILIKCARGPLPPGTTTFDGDAYKYASLYMAERARAATERKSGGTEEKVDVALDFAEYSSGNLPPLMFLKRFVGNMQNHYPETLFRLFLVNPPFFLRGVWAVLTQILDPVTAGKVLMVTGDAQKEKILGPMVAKDQALPFMLPGGKGLTVPDMENFLSDTPFSLGCL